MTDSPRIALIHATRLAIDPIELAASELWPEAETVTILEEGLSIDRVKSEELSLDLRNRITELTRYAYGLGSDGVLFTCSAFGEAIDAASDEFPIPVMKPNEAMFAEALAMGDRVVLITTFAPAAAGMEKEFRETAALVRPSATLRSVYCDNAIAAKRAGDKDTHDALIAETAATIRDADVIMLGQFSMSGSASIARTRTEIPILTSPESAINAIRKRITTKQRVIKCT